MYFHGSKVSGIKELKPNLSSHDDSYVYLTTNRSVALIYTVNAIERFYEINNLDKPSEFQPWYSYGFDKDKNLVIEEYYENAFVDTYKGKSGYIYTCKEPKEYNNPTNIFCAITTKENVEVLHEEYIEDVYEELNRLIEIKEIKLIGYHQRTQKSLEYIDKMILEDIKKYDLINNPDSNYSVFLRAKFPHLFK